jgi:Uma2 family endonuclease
MATISRTSKKREIEYPTSDGRPMAETDVHRDDMVDLIQTLKARYATNPTVYVSGNLLIYYVEGDKHKHVSPDVFVVRGIPNHRRLYYLVWEEGKAPEVVIELTSKSTRREDLKEKFLLYQDTFKVKEYFLFDPYAEYLEPPLQGYRLRKGKFAPVKMVKGRLPSKILALHLERVGEELRLVDPATGQRLPTREEATAQAEAARQQAEAEVERLRQELQAVRGNLPKAP